MKICTYFAYKAKKGVLIMAKNKNNQEKNNTKNSSKNSTKNSTNENNEK